MVKEIVSYKDYTLLDLGYQYVVAYKYDENQPEGSQWAVGTYFSYSYQKYDKLSKAKALLSAVDYFLTKVSNGHISCPRLEEISTMALHGLIEDDKDSAMEFFENEIELTDNECKFFGIEMESEEY